MTTESLEKQYSHYHRKLPAGLTHVDVYAVLKLFECDDAAVAHALKKLLCAGKRGAKDRNKDLREARDSITRALELDEAFGQNTLDEVFGKMLDLMPEPDGMDGVDGCCGGPPGPVGRPMVSDYTCPAGISAYGAADQILTLLRSTPYSATNKLTVHRCPVGTAAALNKHYLDFVLFADV